ncbi:MAG: antibiotic biosynthesis monooxygenase [Chloroflexota bacterium]|nr:antibiotic biosynthesis monooxygenase [Chloroflexota bacterium]
MYGTVARTRLKPGMEERMRRMSDAENALQIPGFIAQYVYQMDADPNEYYLVVIFESKEAYFANANNPEQNARYQEMVEMMAAPPEWHDGEIVYVWPPQQ